jgi:hypothetical protein
LRQDVALGEGFFRLSLLSGGPPFSLFDMLQELDVPFVVCPLGWWFFCLLGCGSFHFVPCIQPFFLGCFGSIMSDTVSSFLLLLMVRAFHNQKKFVVALSGTFLQERPFQVRDKTAPILVNPQRLGLTRRKNMPELREESPVTGNSQKPQRLSLSPTQISPDHRY